VGSKYLGSRLKRGVSDLIIVLALISVAIPITIAVQHWLTSQVGRATAYSIAPKATATLISMDYRGSNFTALIKIANRGVSDLNLSNVNAVVIFANGSNTSATLKVISGEQLLTPNNEATLLLTLSNINSRVVSIILECKDVSGNKLPVELIVS